MERWILRVVAILGLLVAVGLYVPWYVKERLPAGVRTVMKMSKANPESGDLAEAGKDMADAWNAVRNERDMAKGIGIVSLTLLSITNLVIAKRLPKRRAEGEGKK